MRHRNDNALQLVVSLLRLRLARLEAATAASLTPIVDEIESLVRAQAHLNRHPGAARILRPPLEELCGALSGQNGGAVVTLNAKEVEIAPGRLVPILLLAHEAVANALRHGFPTGPDDGDAEGTVRVRLEPHGAAGLMLEIADDGIGLPAGSRFPDPGDAGRGGRRLGGQLIKGFARQLGGRLEVVSGPGVRLTLTID